MADKKIETNVTDPQSQIATDGNLTITDTGSVIVDLTGEYGTDSKDYAVQSTTGTSGTGPYSNTITLNGAVSITDKTADTTAAESSHDTYGVKVYNETSSDYTATIKTDSASSIDVTRDTTSKYQVKVYGIGGDKTNLTFDGGTAEAGKFQDAITVSATNSNKNDAGDVLAYGINGKVITFEDELAAAIKATATAEANAAKAYGINANNVTVTKGITKDITATATGAATTDARTNTFAYGINGNSTLTIGAGTASAGLAGAITANATANATLTGDKTKGYTGAAYAYGITAQNATLTIYGNVTKNITATATANKATQVDNGAKTDVSGWAVAYGISASNKVVSITGTLAGAIEATATAKTNLAAAIAITGNAVKIDNGITKDITATATGAATASEACDIDAYGIQAICNTDATGIIIGTSENKAGLAGAITATATGSATLTGDGETGYAGNANAYAIYAYNNTYANGKVTINGDVTGDMTATAKANSETQSDGTVVGGTATAYGIYTSGAVNITGALAREIKATATAEANTAKAYGIYTSSTADIRAINAAITATANGGNGNCSYAYGIKSDGELTVSGDITEAITAKVTTATFQTIAAKGYGISSAKVDVGGDITGAVTVTVTANSVEQANGYKLSGSAAATGINGASEGGISISGKLAGAIKVTATNKANLATADGLYTSNGTDVTVTGGITGAITATATGTANVGTIYNEAITSGTTKTNAYGIRADKNVIIGNTATTTAIGGAITATATGSAMLGYDGTVYEGNAEASAIQAKSGAVTINGDVTGDLTATVTAKGLAQSDGTVVGGTATAYGVNATGAVSVTGALAGAVKATATAEANTAEAYGISAGTAITVAKGITQDITATATGAATAESEATTKAYGINSNGAAVTIGTASETETAIGGDITATATGSSTLTDDKTAGYAGNVYAYAINSNNDAVTLNGDVTGDLTATAMATSVTQSDGTVVGGYAWAYGIQASEAITIGGALAGDINVAATAEANYARAYGIKASGTVSVAGINAAITATANGADGGMSFAYGIRSAGGLTVNGDISKAITVKMTATPTGASSADSYGIYGEKVDVKGDITGAVTATVTANSVKQASGFAASGTATAYGIAGSSNGGTSISGKLAGDISATATGKGNKAIAYGLYASNKTNVVVSKGITGNITATATGTAKVGTDTEGKGSDTTTNAYGIYSTGDGGNIVITGAEDGSGNNTAIGGDITATSTGSAMLGQSQDVEGGKVYMGNAAAYAITATAGTVTLNGDVTGDITATAMANSETQSDGAEVGGTAYAYGINAKNAISVGNVNAAIKATAAAEANAAKAYGISGNNVTINKGITKDITATATGAATTDDRTNTFAYGINGNSTLTIGAGTASAGLAGAITANATANATLTGDKTAGYAGNAAAYGINGASVTLNGDVTEAITATAMATSVTQSDGNAVGGTATAYGIIAAGAVSITGALAGDITATATAEANTATATGIYAEGNVDLTGAVSGVISATATSVTTYAYAYGIDGEGSALNVGSDLGTIRVSAAGVGDDVVAFGIYGNSLTFNGDRLTANVAVKSSSSAFGISVDSITEKDGTAGVAKLNVSVTGESATGITLKNKADLTLQESSITAHASQAESLCATAGDTAQKITLDKSTLAGCVNLEGGDDTLTLKGSSMITGDVDMGNDTDTLSISSGSRITGDITGAESTTLVLDDLTYASSVLWEGASFGGGTLTLDFSSNMLKDVTTDGVTFNLLKDTDSEWSGTSVNLTVDGSGMSQTLTQGTEQAFGSFKYLLGTSADSKTLTVTVTRTGGTAEDPGIVTDTDKPTITVDTSASTFKQGDTFWFQQGAVATVTGTDTTSGVHYLTRTEGDWTYNISGNTAKLDLELELDAAATVSYTATDRQGNVSDAATVKYNVDGSEPTIAEAAVSGAKEVDGAYWIKQGDAATVGANVTDAKSGVKEVKFNGDTVAVGAGDVYAQTYDTAAEHGLTDYTLAATDNVGNAADETLQIGVDGTPVDISFSTLGENLTVEGTNITAKAGTTFSLVTAFSDALSGVNADSVTLNGEAIALGAGDEYTKILVAPEDGEEYTLTFVAEDNVGNKVEKSVYVGFDDTAPVIGEVTVDESYKSGENAYWVKQDADVTVGATVTDDKSGVKEVTFDGTVGTGIDDVYTMSYDTSTEHGQTDYILAATDNVGNAAEAKTLQIGVDGTGPTITVTKDPTTISASGVTVTADISDGEGSGVAESLYSLDDGATWTAYTGAITVTQNTKILFKATDNVGNVSEATEYVTNAAKITVTADSEEKMYDSTTLTASGYTYSGTLVAGDVLTATVSGEITHVGTTDSAVTGYKVMRGDQDVTSDYTFNDSVNGTLSITKRDVTITSGDATKVYDGTALANDTITVSGSGFVSGEGANYDNFASQTDVGSTANTFSYMLANGTSESDYAVTTANGTLEVTQRNITLKGTNLTKEYDGTALAGGGDITDTTAGLTDKGYVSGEEFTYSFTGSQLFVGTSDNVFSVSDSQTAEVNNYNVTTQYGTLEITGRTIPLTITVEDQTKTYDGTASIDTTAYTVTGDLATGDTITVTLSNTNVNAGTYTDGIIANYTIMHDNGDGTKTDVTDMYLNVTVDAGDLTINQRILTVSGTTADGKLYDGNTTAVIHAGTLDGVVGSDDVSIDTATGTFAGKDAGNGQNVSIVYMLKGEKSANYTVEGSMTTADIEKRDVTLTSGSATKEWDGTPLTNDTVTVTGDGFIDGEGATYDVTGSQTDPGTSANTFSYTLNNGTQADNYAITTVEGMLTVFDDKTPPTVTIDADTTTLLETITFFATATDNVNVAKFEYSTDGGASWTDAENGGTSVTTKKTATANGTWSFRATDGCGNVSETQTVTFTNVNQGGKSVEVAEGKTVVVKEPTETETIDLKGGTLDASQAPITAKSLVASEGKSTFLGATEGIDAVSINDGASLNLDLVQYDELTERDALSGAGQLNVSSSEGVPLTLDHIAGVFTSDTIDNVAFEQSLDTAINKLSFGTSKTVVNKTTYKGGSDEVKSMLFGDATGTKKTDKITFGTNTNVTIGSEGATLDLQGGSDTIKVDKTASATIYSDVKDVQKITTGTQSTLATGDLAGTESKTLSVSVGANGTFTAGDITNVRKIYASSGRKYRASTTDKTRIQGTTTFTAGDVTGTAKGDSIHFCKYNDASLGTVSLGAGNDEVRLCQNSTLDIDVLDFGDGSDTLRVRANATVDIGTLDFGDGKSDTLKVEKNATINVGSLDVDSLDNLTLGSGSVLVLSDAGDYDAAQDKWGKKYGDQITLASVA